MGGATDIANSGSWTIQASNYNAATTIDTCNGGPTNDCLHFSAADPSQGSYYIFFTYSTAVVTGSTYAFTFEMSQTTNVATSYSVYTSNTGNQVNVAFNGAANTWQTVTLTATAVLGATNFNVLAQVTNVNTDVTFGNFNFYEVCPETGAS